VSFASVIIEEEETSASSRQRRGTWRRVHFCHRILKLRPYSSAVAARRVDAS
jgi:hypothetical protein